MRSCYRTSFANVLVLLALSALGSAGAQAYEAQDAGAKGCVPAAQALLNPTPVTLRILQASLIPVPATDGFIHLAYAAQITNISPQAALITSIVPVDPTAGFDPSGMNRVVDSDGNDVTGKVFPFKRLIAGTVLEGGSAGTTFFDVRYSRPQDIPRSLSHRISVKFEDAQAPEFDEKTDPIPVGCMQAVVLSPPLAGPRW